VVQCAAVCCSVLQCVAVCCSVVAIVCLSNTRIHYFSVAVYLQYGVATISRLLKILGLFCRV